MIQQHLFGPGPNRILAFDGGGIRGAISIAFLIKIETTLKQLFGQHTKISDYFDLIGGTSSGAILAGAAAIGLSGQEMFDFFTRLAPTVFRRSMWRIAGFQSKFDARHLQAQLESVLGDITLESHRIKTGVCVV